MAIRIGRLFMKRKLMESRIGVMCCRTGIATAFRREAAGSPLMAMAIYTAIAKTASKYADRQTNKKAKRHTAECADFMDSIELLFEFGKLALQCIHVAPKHRDFFFQ